MTRFFRNFLALVVLTGMAGGLVAQNTGDRNPTLKIGDPAPAINVIKWTKTKGSEIARFKEGEAVNLEPGQVYVVEFWATWCGPCKMGMPHLSELARHYQGTVTFMGISVKENRQSGNSEYISKVEDFVKHRSASMDYNVGIDGPENIMNNTWLVPAGLRGIPAAVVVNKEGKIGWMGHPMFGLDAAIELALAGKLDAKTGQALVDENNKNTAIWSSHTHLVNKALEAKDFATDNAVPGFALWTTQNRYKLLSFTDSAAAKQLAEKHFQANYLGEESLMMLGTFIVENDLQHRDYDLALKMLLRVRELQVNSHTNVRLNDFIARSYAALGDYTNAAKFQEENLKLAQAAGSGVDAAQKRLDEYKEKINK
jgi:thiol-disulfide isomerase/thioredoxin